MDWFKANKVDQIISFARLHDITLVSYGLAPNSNGFCYEVEDTSCAAADDFEILLDSLNTKEVAELRKRVFG